MNRYYSIVKSELICVNGSVKSDMWERKRVPCPVRMCKLERMRSTKNRKKYVKRGKPSLQPWDLKGGPVPNSNTMYHFVPGYEKEEK